MFEHWIACLRDVFKDILVKELMVMAKGDVRDHFQKLIAYE